MKRRGLLAGGITVLGFLTIGLNMSTAADENEVTAESDTLLGEYEKSSKKFIRTEIGDKIVYFHQRKIDGAIVEKDLIVYQFEKNAGRLLDKKVHWRTDLPESLANIEPTGGVELITREEAQSLVAGDIQFTELTIISPDSDVFPIEPTPRNPCWVVRSTLDGNLVVTVIDAVTGEFLGHGVPPPQTTGFSFSGPMNWAPCDWAWSWWHLNAASWFEEMGYPTEATTWPTEDDIRSHIESTETAVFYEIAHGGSYDFASGCRDGDWGEFTTATDVRDWIAGYPPMPFTFLASCEGLCNTGPGTFSHEFRKGASDQAVTVGYCHMDADYCSSCWAYSIHWQDAFFDSLSRGNTSEEAYEAAMAARPMCFPTEGSCMRLAGDPNLRLVPTVYRTSVIEVPVDIKPGSDPNSINTGDKGVIPVAILTTEDFDALTVDEDSVLFGPAEAEKRHKRGHVEDVDGDGDLDLLLHFRTQDTGIASGDTEACLTGQTLDGVPLTGCDSVRTVPPE